MAGGNRARYKKTMDADQLAALVSLGSLAAVFSVGSYGLHKRRLWAWYLGWVALGCIDLLILLGALGLGFDPEHSLFENGGALVRMAFLAVAFGSLTWWWSRQKGQFQKKKKNRP